MYVKFEEQTHTQVIGDKNFVIITYHFLKIH